MTHDPRASAPCPDPCSNGPVVTTAVRDADCGHLATGADAAAGPEHDFPATWSHNEKDEGREGRTKGARASSAVPWSQVPPGAAAKAIRISSVDGNNGPSTHWTPAHSSAGLPARREATGVEGDKGREENPSSDHPLKQRGEGGEVEVVAPVTNGLAVGGERLHGRRAAGGLPGSRGEGGIDDERKLGKDRGTPLNLQLSGKAADGGVAISSAAVGSQRLAPDVYGVGAGGTPPEYPGGSSNPGKTVPSGMRNPRCRRQLVDPDKLKHAIEVATLSTEAEKAGPGDWVQNVWEESLMLEPTLALAAHPEFAIPQHFYQAMDTCMACLLHAPPDHLRHAERMVKLLDSSDAEPLLEYLDWLEVALEELNPEVLVSTVPVPQRVGSALMSWPAECVLLQKSALALCEALLAHCPEHYCNYSEWRKAVDARGAIQCQQEQECLQVARDLEEAAVHFTSQLQDSTGDEWTHLARTSHASLSTIHQLTGELLQQQREVWSDALEEYEALGARATSYRAAICEARRQVKRQVQAFRQVTQRFTEVAHQLVSWTRTLVPKLRLLMSHRDELWTIVSLRRRLPVLEREHLAAEDELDMAQTELRKHKRHAQASRASPSHTRPTIDAAAGAILERQHELRVTHAEQCVRKLSEQLWELEQKVQEVEAALPVVVEPDDEDSRGTGGQRAPSAAEEQLSPEERLALKLATLEQFHEDVAMQVSQVQAERDRVLQQVAERKERAAMRLQVELDFMCPIMHEKMSEPVLAADGHTYERAAIEKWLQLHNTSPMTGAPLAHRYLTENFALRHVIASHDARTKTGEDEERDADWAGDGLSQACSSAAPECDAQGDAEVE